MKKVLLAEDSKDILEGWLQGLSADGFDFGGKGWGEIVDAKDGISVLTHAGGEFHIVISEAALRLAAAEHSYDLCFLDGLLYQGNSYDVAADFLKAATGPRVCLTSSALSAQVNILSSRRYGLDMDQLRKDKRFEGAVKSYLSNRAALAHVFGFKIPKSLAPKRKKGRAPA